MKPITQWTRREFEALPWRSSWESEEVCDSLVILPQRRLHDSGYRALDFAAVRTGIPRFRLSGCSDVLHFDGIGGYGRFTPGRGIPRMVPVSGWSIDCLPKSGLLHVFRHGKMRAGAALSSFEIYAEHTEALG